MANIFRIFLDAFRRVFPLYASVTFVPMIVLKFFKVLRSPFRFLFQGIAGATQSATFLAAFVALYQSVVCGHRKAFNVDHKIIYWIAGVVSSLSIFIERKSRRAELALYTLPRAAESFYLMMVNRRWFASVPNGEVLLFCIACSGLMYFYREHPYFTMSPFVKSIFNALFKKESKADVIEKARASPLTHSASVGMLGGASTRQKRTAALPVEG